MYSIALYTIMPTTRRTNKAKSNLRYFQYNLFNFIENQPISRKFHFCVFPSIDLLHFFFSGFVITSHTLR